MSAIVASVFFFSQGLVSKDVQSSTPLSSVSENFAPGNAALDRSAGGRAGREWILQGCLNSASVQGTYFNHACRPGSGRRMDASFPYASGRPSKIKAAKGGEG